MFRRSILQLSSRQALRRNNTRVTTQIPSYLCSRNQYSVTPEKNVAQPPGSTGKPPESGNSSRIALIGGGLVLGAAVLTAYKFDELLPFLRGSAPESAKVGTKDPVDFSRGTRDFQEERSLGEKYVISSNEVSNASVPTGEPAETKTETHSDISPVDAPSESEGESQFQGEVSTELSPDLRPVQEKELPISKENVISDLQSRSSEASRDEKNDTKRTESESSIGQHEAAQTKTIPEESSTMSTEPQQEVARDNPEGKHGFDVERPSSLLDKYHLRDEAQPSIPTTSEKETDSINAIQPSIPNISEKQRDLVDATQDSDDNYIAKNGKLVLDFLEAIHAAEKRQAELDAHIFADEKRKMKEKYEKELKDARVRELMYAEEAAIRDKELNRERVKAAAAVKSVREELEEKLKIELEQKEAEAEINLKKMQELAKAELAAAIASEKASQIEKMAEANLHINALCMPFYARSEEARQSHSVHKLALGALALEDALSKGLPIQKEIDALHTYLEGIDKDPLLNLVLSSLPEDTRSSGSDTMLQLRQKFDGLKTAVRHFSLIPPQGGGILTHSLAHVASWLKVREYDQSGDGIESLLNRVESFLAEGKLGEAAETLENGVKGTQAEQVTGDWLKRVRNRAVTEQALTLIQAYATSISLT